MERRIVTAEEMEFYNKASELLKIHNDNFKSGQKNDPSPMSDEDYHRFHEIAGKVMVNKIIEGEEEEQRDAHSCSEWGKRTSNGPLGGAGKYCSYCGGIVG